MQSVQERKGQLTAAVVTNFGVTPVAAQTIGRGGAVQGQDRADLGQRQAQLAQADDEPGQFELAGGVPAVTGVRVDPGRAEQPEAVVQAQGLG